MIPTLPGEGRVPYTPLPRRSPAYTGKIVVPREEGIVESHRWGRFIKLLCNEITGDDTFTLGERIYDPGRSVGPIEGGPSEAIHILEGRGTLRAWLDGAPDSRPTEVPLQPGLEIIVTQNLRHVIRNEGDSPMVALVTICHADFPAYPHHYPAIFQPGKGNSIHMHDNRIEGFYVVSGPGSISIADPDNTVVRDFVVPPRGAAYKPMYVYHRQYNHEPDGEPCYWIHSMVVYTHRGSRMPQLHVRQHGLDGKTPIWERPGN
jgi:oxalate decarboxylase/phosphoglucose isomerase-like protein (cupin superfamily)